MYILIEEYVILPILGLTLIGLLIKSFRNPRKYPGKSDFIVDFILFSFCYTTWIWILFSVCFSHFYHQFDSEYEKEIKTLKAGVYSLDLEGRKQVFNQFLSMKNLANPLVKIRILNRSNGFINESESSSMDKFYRILLIFRQLDEYSGTLLILSFSFILLFLWYISPLCLKDTKYLIYPYIFIAVVGGFAGITFFSLNVSSKLSDWGKHNEKIEFFLQKQTKGGEE